MKIRIRFEKTGAVRFVGHLDFMRTMQKSIRRSGLPAVYTNGFSPHMLMGFAVPLGVGEETTGDYMDLDVALKDPVPPDEKESCRLSDLGLDNEALPECPSSGQLIVSLNKVMPEGVRVTDIVRIGLIKSSKAMALVRSASYDIYPGEAFSVGNDPRLVFEQMVQSPVIHALKETKKGTKEEDIRPLIRSLSYEDVTELPEFLADGRAGGPCIHLTCDTGSVSNLKPAVLLGAAARMGGSENVPWDFRLVRRELYDEEGRTLLELGSSF